MIDRIEVIILAHLLADEIYTRKVIPFLKDEYFSDAIEKVAFEQIHSFIMEYNTLPTKESILIQANGDSDNISDSQYKELSNFLTGLKITKKFDEQWLLDHTEKFCKDKALHNALLMSIKLAGDDSKNLSVGQIPEIMSDALAVSFDPNIGHDYIQDYQLRYEEYHRVERKLPFDLKYFNWITKGGIVPKTLTIILAGTAVGKSLAMCHFASANLLDGKNVLYITLEMSEERIAERIDANLLNIPMKELEDLPHKIYEKSVNKLKAKTSGRMIIKEYPTATATVTNFRHLLNELNLKRDFRPDVIYVDYLNICGSSRLKAGTRTSYEYVKAIAEELRGLAVEQDVPIISATQTNRQGYASSNVDLTDTSESFGVPATADFMFALITNEELENLNQIKVQQLKNRYNDVNVNKRFVVGIDRSKMRLYDLEDSAQKDLVDSGQKTEESIPQNEARKKGGFSGIEM